jgi:murein DD-endopeptidase MepM/ murein hydrolase activator NlpD
MRALLLVALPLLTAALTGCGDLDSLRDRLTPAYPHEAYLQSLGDAGLGSTALAVAWREAAEDALKRPLLVEVPFAEVAYFDPAWPEAVGYRFALRRGDRLRVRLALQPPARPGDTARVFLDLFALPDDTLRDGRPSNGRLRTPERVAGADEHTAADALAFSFEPDDDGAFLLRVQPELLYGGRVRVEVRTEPVLAVFPVAGYGPSAVRSFWGEPRDGGARRHEGIDIFAPRGTPAVAASGGVVSLRDGGLGGKTVWIRAGRLSLYYAHLDSQLVTAGQRVAAGDTVGWVGNTGNARTTPPHLHFGVYGFGGATDPFPFVDGPRPEPVAIRADTAVLGTWARLTRPVDFGAPGMSTGVPVRLVGAEGGRYRVVGADGTSGYVDDGAVTMRPLRRARLAQTILRAGPRADAAVVDSVGAETAFEVIGAAGGFLLVREGARTGWVAE